METYESIYADFFENNNFELMDSYISDKTPIYYYDKMYTFGQIKELLKRNLQNWSFENTEAYSVDNVVVITYTPRINDDLYADGRIEFEISRFLFFSKLKGIYIKDKISAYIFLNKKPEAVNITRDVLIQKCFEGWDNNFNIDFDTYNKNMYTFFITELDNNTFSLIRDDSYILNVPDEMEEYDMKNVLFISNKDSYTDINSVYRKYVKYESFASSDNYEPVYMNVKIYLILGQNEDEKYLGIVFPEVLEIEADKQ